MPGVGDRPSFLYLVLGALCFSFFSFFPSLSFLLGSFHPSSHYSLVCSLFGSFHSLARSTLHVLGLFFLGSTVPPPMARKESWTGAPVISVCPPDVPAAQWLARSGMGISGGGSSLGWPGEYPGLGRSPWWPTPPAGNRPRMNGDRCRRHPFAQEDSFATRFVFQRHLV